MTQGNLRVLEKSQNDSNRKYYLFSVSKNALTLGSSAGSERKVISPSSSKMARSKVTLKTPGVVIIRKRDEGEERVTSLRIKGSV